MRVLSLFDGISAAQQALKTLGIKPEVYYASEIDKYAIQITQKNFPDTIQIGDITKFTKENFPEIFNTEFDLIIGGSPCQDLSIAKNNRKGLDGGRSGLFYEFVRILKEVKHKYFLLENVYSMSKDSAILISRIIGVHPVMINSALLTAQNRKRFYWTNIKGTGMYGEVEQPEDKGILLKDILEDAVTDREKSFCVDANYYKGGSVNNYLEKSKRQLVFSQSENRLYNIKPIQLQGDSQGNRVYSIDGKSINLSANGGGKGAKTGLYMINKLVATKMNTLTEAIGRGGSSKEFMSMQNKLEQLTGTVRKLTPMECERLQGFPDNYTEGISNTQRYRALGNSFTVPVISHILSHII